MKPEPTRLRQIALVAKDLDSARHLLTRVLGTEVVYEDPLVAQWGLKNFLVAIGGDIVEVVSPVQSNTTAERLLQKRGEGGYMIIMQTSDATARRKHIEENNLGKIIFTHEVEGGESVCVQYHPKGVPGGVIPELDSHCVTPSNPDPLGSSVSPWHACGPTATQGNYLPIMRRNRDLHLIGATLRLRSEETNTQNAAQRWEKVFGVKSSGSGIQFTNATMNFISGEHGQADGIVDITIGVEGRRRLEEILWRAKVEGIAASSSGGFEMFGVNWKFVLADYLRRNSRI